jgi:hypothetical protein
VDAVGRGVDAVGPDAAAITCRGAVLSRGAALVGAGFGRGADTTTSGTRTAPAAGAAGVVGAAGGLGSAGGGSAGAGVEWSDSVFGASVDPVGGADDSCVRPGAAINAAQIRTAAKCNIDGWSRDRIDMTRFEMTAIAARVGKRNVLMREDIESSRAVANRVVGRADQPKTEMLIGGPR